MPTTFLQRIETIGLFSQIRDSTYAYPVLLWLHLVALAVWCGLMLMTDLRLLGVRAAKDGVAEAFGGYRWPKRISFLFAALCGLLLFGTRAGQYAYNPWFWFKMLLLLLLGASYLTFRRGLAANPSPGLSGKMKLAGGLSLVLWMGSVGVARGPATVKDMMHAMVDPSSEFLFDSVMIISDEEGTREIAPRTDADWDQVRARAEVLLKMPDLLTAPGRRFARPRDRAVNPQAEIETAEMQRLRSENPQEFVHRAQDLRDAMSVTMRAINAKDKDALFDAMNDIDRACEGCHVRYWYPNDKRAVEAAREAGIIE